MSSWFFLDSLLHSITPKSIINTLSGFYVRFINTFSWLPPSPRDQTPPNTPQCVRIASQRQECDSCTLDSPQQHWLPRDSQGTSAPSRSTDQDVLGGQPVWPDFDRNTVLQVADLNAPREFNSRPAPMQFHEQAPPPTPNTAAEARDHLAQLQAQPRDYSQSSCDAVPQKRLASLQNIINFLFVSHFPWLYMALPWCTSSQWIKVLFKIMSTPVTKNIVYPEVLPYNTQ